MRKVLDFITRLVCSALMFVISYCFGVNVMGVLSVAFGFEDAVRINYGVWGICIVMFLVAMFLYWSGRMSTKSVSGVKCCKMVVGIGFGGIVASSVAYMVILKEVLQTMLILAIVTWLCLFVFIKVLNDIEKSLSTKKVEETEVAEETKEN